MVPPFRRPPWPPCSFILFFLFQDGVVHNFNELRFWDSGRFCKYVDIPTIFSVPVFEAFLTTRQERFFHLLIRAHRFLTAASNASFHSMILPFRATMPAALFLLCRYFRSYLSIMFLNCGRCLHSLAFFAIVPGFTLDLIGEVFGHLVKVGGNF